MDKILAPIKQRIIQFIENNGIERKTFFEKIDVAASNFRSQSLKSEIGSDIVAKISSLYPNLNLDWLINGNGEMLKSEAEAIKAPVGIPLVVGVKAVGGFGNGDFSIEERDIKEYYVVPKFKHKKVDFMIEVDGSSMYPKYNSGDVVACRIIKEIKFIQWNKTHVIASKSQGIIIKRLKQGTSSDTLLIVSDNKDYSEFEVPKEDIDGLALVVGVIRLE